MATRSTRARVARAPRPARKVAPDFYGPDESPEGESIAQPKEPLEHKAGRGATAQRGRAGRPIVPRMPLVGSDGKAFRPRAKGSKGVQPAVQLGPLTGQLPIARTVGTIPYSEITSSLGKLIRSYRAHLASAEKIWQQLETLERGLRDLVVEDEGRGGIEA